MTIGRQAFRAALLLACSTFSLTAFSPAVLSQTPPPVLNRQPNQSPVERPTQIAADEETVRGLEDEHDQLAQPKVWLGIGLKEISGDLAAYLGSTDGVLIENVFPDSPAKAADIRVGDIIIAINGEQIANPRALIEALLKVDSSKSTPTLKGGKQSSKDVDKQEDTEQNEDDAEKRRDDKEGQSAKKKTAYPTLKLTVLRQGKEMTVEVTPTDRPESWAGSNDSGERAVEVNGDLEDMLRELESQGGTTILRFGPPTALGEPIAEPSEKRVENMVIIVQDAGGKPVEVRIQRSGDERPKITVREGEKTREITEDQIDQLPEMVRKAVRQALRRQEETRREQLESAQRGLRGQTRHRIEENQRLHEQLGELPGGHITILGPEELQEMGKSAEELAAKYQKMAEAMAKRGMQKAQDLTALPNEVKELRTQVDELKKQLEELQEQIKADKE